MSNHYHLLIETPEGKLVDGMRRLNGVYTQAFNRRHSRVGHVLQGRYKSILVDRDAYLLELARYIVLNPVRAGMVQRVDDWPWSSYGTTVGKCEMQNWLDSEWIVKQFGANLVTARQAYRRFVREGMGISSPWESLRGQVYLGGDKFLARMEKLAAAQDLQGIPAVQKQPTRPDAEAVLKAVAKSFCVTTMQIQNRSHQQAFKLGFICYAGR